MGEIVTVWLLGLGSIGFAIGLILVLTLPAPARWRVAGTAVVLAASVVGIAAVVIGVARPIFGFFAAPLLTPTLAALAFRIFIPSRLRSD